MSGNELENSNIPKKDVFGTQSIFYYIAVPVATPEVKGVRIIILKMIVF
jgi:hypothetical protein